MERPSILWIVSYLRHPSGNAEEARTFLRALDLAGGEPAAMELGTRGRETVSDGRTVALEHETLEAVVRAFEREPREPLVAVHAYTPRAERRFTHPGAANVARAMFETDRLPEGWALLLAERDAVWVPSRHTRDVFAAAGVPESKLSILGETLDFERFKPGAAEPLELDAPDGHFVFLSNFDFSERKGWRQLLQAWARAFDANDPVCLVLKTLSVARWDEDYVRERIRHYVEGKLGNDADRLAPIVIRSERMSAADVPRLYAGADAYVSPSRGEAWGRTYMEAMAMGLPTVGSDWSGNLDFMDGEDCWLVPGELVPVAGDAEVVDELYRGHRWFEADVDSLAEALREIASDPAAARARAAPARERLLATWGEGPIAKRIAELAEDALDAAQSPESASA
ncbi:MAG: glycosyltransferase [Solirubrobacterales bacterium]|nr:glycosyltransferase [Solirubrobacterales bacterium]